MGLVAFQRAMADLSASLELCEEVKARGSAALERYDLTELELRRIEAAIRQRGMRVNRMLYRSNRLAPLVSQLRQTCFLLGPWLRELADGYWSEHPVPERNAPIEIRRFAAHVRRWLADGAPADPVVGEVLAWELEIYELGTLGARRILAEIEADVEGARPEGPLRAHPLVGLVRFSVDPAALMGALAEQRLPPYPEAAVGDFALLVDFRVEPRVMHLLPIEHADAYAALRAGERISPEEAAPLIERGLALAA